jgi:hypothetical protein
MHANGHGPGYSFDLPTGDASGNRITLGKVVVKSLIPLILKIALNNNLKS